MRIGRNAHVDDKFLAGALFIIFFPQILVGERTISCHTLGSEAERSTDGVAGARGRPVPLLFFEYLACAACLERRRGAGLLVTWLGDAERRQRRRRAGATIGARTR